MIETKTNALAEASAGLAQKAYEQAQQQEGAADAGASPGGGEAGGGEDVVDAEFEEVKEDENKS